MICRTYITPLSELRYDISDTTVYASECDGLDYFVYHHKTIEVCSSLAAKCKGQ